MQLQDIVYKVPIGVIPGEGLISRVDIGKPLGLIKMDRRVVLGCLHAAAISSWGTVMSAFAQKDQPRRRKALAVSIIYETHSLSTDNELGIATGWNDGQLSEQGRADAKELGERRVHDGIDAVFASDLGRAVETVKIAFVDSRIPIYLDSRLRECNYGDWNGAPVTRIHSSRSEYIVQPYPNGHSYSDVVRGMATFLNDLANWSGHRVLIVAHAATRWALDHLINGVPLENLVDAPFNWQKGWQYTLAPNWSSPGAHAK
jgi:broad specificity phosphatase PhoE